MNTAEGFILLTGVSFGMFISGMSAFLSEKRRVNPVVLIGWSLAFASVAMTILALR